MTKVRINIEVSARHIHLTKNDFEVLFGKGEILDIRNYLSQPNLFASNKTVEVVGPEQAFNNVRVLGPFREYSQVEISRSDAILTGINAPYKISGDLPGAKVRVIGPKGEITKDIAIVPKRHIHLNNLEAQKLKLRSGQHLSVSVGGNRSTIFHNVEVRVAENFKKTCHLDTDEGNSAGIDKRTTGIMTRQ